MTFDFRRNLALLSGTPIVRLVTSGLVKWTPERRMRVALANDNQGKWYLCNATKSVADIERRFVEGSVARVLYQTVGGILGDHKKLKTVGSHYLYVQLSRRDVYVDMSLNDVGIRIMAPILFKDIRHY